MPLAYRASALSRLRTRSKPFRQRLGGVARAAVTLSGLRHATWTLRLALHPLRSLLLVLAWWTFTFALIGLQPFRLRLARRCALCADVSCTAALEGSTVWSELPCGRGRSCASPLDCLPSDHAPAQGWASFDSFRWACLSVLRLQTLGVRGWRVACATSERPA